MMPRRVVVGIDASRNRSGGAKGHLVGILRDSDPREHGIDELHVWSYAKLLAALPDRPWLVKHGHVALERSLPHQLWWQWRQLPREARAAGCQVLLNTDAGSICRFRPAVVMSRDMLSYEPGEIDRFSGKAWLRLWALRHVQNRSLRFADGAIFLTRYAARVIQHFTGPLQQVAVVPHGVGDEFRGVARGHAWPMVGQPVHCLYVSNAAPYKHQWHVVRAFAELRQRGFDVRLKLVGGGSGPAQQRLDAEIARSDPQRAFVTTVGHLPAEQLPSILATADMFVFASSCENMPNTLVEAMAAGLPIACSNRGPMPEVLADAGAIFDPEDPSSIVRAVESLLVDSALRARCALRAETLSEQYSWRRCGHETWKFLRTISENKT
jgi:glycosyltransferase involved in cell wall biosynthesis